MPNWYPGQNAPNTKVFSEAVQFASVVPPAFQQGIATNPPVVTQPGTAGPGTAVVNNTGKDCMVYMSATVGFGGVSMSTYGTVTAGTYPVGQTLPVYVPAGASITVNYVNTGVLTWHWIPV